MRAGGGRRFPDCDKPRGPVSVAGGGYSSDHAEGRRRRGTAEEPRGARLGSVGRVSQARGPVGGQPVHAESRRERAGGPGGHSPEQPGRRHHGLAAIRDRHTGRPLLEYQVNNRNQIGSYYSTDTVLRFTQPLLRGRGSGPTRRELEDAESELRSAEAKGAETRRDVALQVATAYLQVVTATRVAAVAEKTLERASTLREAAQAKLTAGIVSRLDVLRAQQLVAQAEAEQLNALAAVEDAKDALRVLLTRPPDWPFRVEIDLHATDLTIGAEEAVRTALDRREELRTAKEDFSQADRAVAFRRNQLLPEFDLGLALTRYGTATDLRSSFGVNDFHLATFAGVSIPIDRTAAQIDLQNALFERERRRRAIDATSAHIIAGVRQALRQLDLARRSSQMAEAGVGLAREEAEVAGLRYQRGLSDNLDVVKAEADLLAADCRRMAATADLMLAGLKLRAALGVLDPDADIG